jgi:predicted transcriptional regulator
MKVYIYCTKGKPYLHYRPCDNCTSPYVLWDEKSKEHECLNGKIVAEFELNEVDKIETELYKENLAYQDIRLMREDETCEFDILASNDTSRDFNDFDFMKNICISKDELCDYVGEGFQKCYAWHIHKLNIFDNPKVLPEWNVLMIRIKKSPQSWCYARDQNDELCIIISINPEHVCKILNGEKTIEVRKTKPKEMEE